MVLVLFGLWYWGELCSSYYYFEDWCLEDIFTTLYLFWETYCRLLPPQLAIMFMLPLLSFHYSYCYLLIMIINFDSIYKKELLYGQCLQYF